MRAALADAHCHADQLVDPAGELAAAVQLGVRSVLSCSEDAPSMSRNLDLAARFPDTVLAGIGLHPAVVAHQSDETVADGLAFLQTHVSEAAFVGEVGLDYLHAATRPQQERQRQILMEQVALASAARLPVCLHSRRAERDALGIAAICSESWGIPALLHWFTHSEKLVRLACRTPDVFISAGPSVLRDPSALAVAVTITPDHLLLETDSPVSFGGQPASPSWIPRVARVLAAARGMTVDDLVVLLDENLRRFLYAGSSGGHQTRPLGDARDAPSP